MHLLEPSCARRMWSAAVAIALVWTAVTIIAAEKTVASPEPEPFTVVEAPIDDVQAINPRAVQEAERLDAAFSASGPVGPLHCVAVLVKDQIDTSDMPTTHGFVGFKDFVPAADATIVTR